MVNLFHIKVDSSLAWEGRVDEFEGVMFSVDLEIPGESFLGTGVRKEVTLRDVCRITFRKRRWLWFRSFWIGLVFLCIFFKMKFTFLNYDCLITIFLNWFIDINLLSKSLIEMIKAKQRIKIEFSKKCERIELSILTGENVNTNFSFQLLNGN